MRIEENVSFRGDSQKDKAIKTKKDTKKAILLQHEEIGEKP
jgi:hypothetical protein